ncbi:MAG: flavin reductase family protein [Eubacterium sp.]|nr:flavin reductase family protein [Eubacterium sp.]
MGKMDFKPGNMLYPLPAVLVTVRDGDGKDNLFTVAWAGTVCTNPPMLSVSVRPSRHSYKMMKETGVFAVNLTTRSMARQTDYCGVRSGRDHDKWEETGLTKEEGKKISVSVIAESPVNIECRVRQVIPLGSHDLFLADVVHVTVDEKYMDEKGGFHLEKADPIVYSHGKYFDLGTELGTFGYSVRKKNRKRRKEKGK